MNPFFIALAALFTASGAFANNAKYVESLRAKYASRITYRTPQARQVVQSFEIDCKSPDGRSLPLVNVFLSKLASVDTDRAHMVIDVDGRGDEVRITDRLISATGQVMYSVVAFEINKWGELRSLNGKSEALLNACYGSQGPIWRMP